MIELAIKLVLFLFPLAYSPGPGNLFFAATGARFGFTQTLQALTGYHVATWLVTLAIGFGFGWVATEFPSFLTVIKYAGSAYVLYLAFGLIRAGAIEGDAEAKRASIMDGVLLLVLNPKAYVIIALMFTQFTEKNNDTQTGLIVLITTVFTLNNLVAFSLWAYVGDRLASAFRNDQQARRLNVFFGCMLAGVALWMLLG